MELPFTESAFFGVFADYNAAFAGVALVLWLGTIALLARLRRRRPDGSHALSAFLAVLWFWNAIAYHALFFARINPAAWLFAALFLVQAALFVWLARRDHIAYLSVEGWRYSAGVGLVIYALLYPILTVWLGHAYPAAPTYGVPCPTDLLTLGVLLSARGVPWAATVIPLLWAGIGGSAAFLLGVPTDYMLLAGAALLILSRSTRQKAAVMAT